MLAITGIVAAVDNNSSDSNETFDKLMEMYLTWEEAKKQANITSGIDVKDLGIVKNNPNVMKARGKMAIADVELETQALSEGLETQVLIEELETRALSERFDQILFNSQDEIIEKYAHPNGPVIGQGHASGYISVLILVGSEMDDETLDSIYNIIEQEANKLGIENVPVVFEYEEIPQEDVGLPDIEESNMEISADKIENEDENRKTTPGFSALSLLLVFSIIMRFRKK